MVGNEGESQAHPGRRQVAELVLEKRGEQALGARWKDTSDHWECWEGELTNSLGCRARPPLTWNSTCWLLPWGRKGWTQGEDAPLFGPLNSRCLGRPRAASCGQRGIGVRSRSYQGQRNQRENIPVLQAQSSFSTRQFGEAKKQHLQVRDELGEGHGLMRRQPLQPGYSKRCHESRSRIL